MTHWRVVPKELLDRLLCPRCYAGVTRTTKADRLECDEGHRFALNGYLDASGSGDGDPTAEKTLASFGYEWNTFDDIRKEDRRFVDNYFKDLDLRLLDGRVGLDAGSGKGRFTRFMAPHL